MTAQKQPDNDEKPVHKAGFVNIIGRPNAGKSTLMNALVGHKLSSATSKAQTTRHRIFGILNGDNFQMVFSDTPGIIETKYKLQEQMMKAVNTTIDDADVLLVMADVRDEVNEQVLEIVKRAAGVPILVLLNKLDLSNINEAEKKADEWKAALPETDSILPVSALHQLNLDHLMAWLLNRLPEHPAYFPKDDSLSDKTDRFFASEMVREHIFELYHQEIPYSSEVVVTSFKEEKGLLRIRAEIYVERTSQRQIIIGKGGSAIKELGIRSRKSLEEFFGQKIFLETHVKVEENWRNNQSKLRRFGYAD